MIEEYFTAQQSGYEDRALLIRRSGTPPDIKIEVLAANNRKKGWFRIKPYKIYPQQLRCYNAVPKPEAVAILLQSKPLSEEFLLL